MVCRHEIGFELTNLVKTGEVSNWLYTHKNMRARYIYPTCKITKAGARDLRVQRTPRNKRQKAREPAEEREDKRDRCFAEEQGKKEGDMKNKSFVSDANTSTAFEGVQRAIMAYFVEEEALEVRGRKLRRLFRQNLEAALGISSLGR